jgi:hypothetical protein
VKEYNIQSHSEEVKQIIHHANTEAKYENIFKAIEKEWDNSTLKVVPI